MARRGLLVHVTGVVQGVGFRPFVHRLATRHDLAGWVRNEAGDVEIAIEGSPEALEAFLLDLTRDAPPLARIERVVTQSLPHSHPSDLQIHTRAFQILDSHVDSAGRQPVPADVALCEACERELLDAANRRNSYPFITCTDCGPRYTVIESLPYDRERTTMRAFTQCPECLAEYDTPGDRRHHSETNGCSACGPRLWVRVAGARRVGGVRVETRDGGQPLGLVASFLRAGAIVALRGLGGFHLSVDATNELAVRRLRERKRRDAKPFAIMVRTLDDANELAELTDADRAALSARERPIVLVRRRQDAELADGIAPGLESIGIMLAYTPLHHLLLQRVDRPLVMTSGNRSDEPIAASIPDAIDRLDDIADLFLLHDREIVTPIDDSVVRVIGGAPALLRRARGYAPLPLSLPDPAPMALIAVGAHLKSTFTIVDERSTRAFVSPHLGDLDNFETLAHYKATLERYEDLFRIEPRVVVRDLHPGYLSTRVADELALDRVIAVQHHHAHIAAVMGEHGLDEPVLGVAFDGTGYGDDATVWGAELLLCDRANYQRLGHLRRAPLPGGDLAVRSPWRSALGYLSLAPELAPMLARAFVSVAEQERTIAERQLGRRVNAPLASSMGRLFDAAAATLGVRRHVRYEGEAAMALESLAGDREGEVLPFPSSMVDGRLQLDPLPLLDALGARALDGVPIPDLAAAFHDSVVAGTATAVGRLCGDANVKTVVLGGGVFQNARLTAALRSALEGDGHRVFTPRQLPANDGGVSYGQAVVAIASLSRATG